MAEGGALLDLMQRKQQFVREGQRESAQNECAGPDRFLAARRCGIFEGIGEKVEGHETIFSRGGLSAAAAATNRPRVCIAFSLCASQACP